MYCKKSFDKEMPKIYSKVLEIECSRLVVICGQVGEDENENLVGNTIESQAQAALENCRAELLKAGCTLAEVFKVNVYIANMKDWGRFNEIYQRFFTIQPLPVRTTVQAGLPEGYLVEIEMWAAKV